MKGHKVLKLGQKWLYHDSDGELRTGIVTKIDLAGSTIVITDKYCDLMYLRAKPDLPVPIEYIKTGERECGTNVYDVIKGGNKLGRLYRAYTPAIGIGPRYVGHSAGCCEWVLDVEEWAYDRGYIRGGCYHYDSLKAAKAWLADETRYKELP